METHSSISAWKIPGTEEPGGLHSVGSQESDTTLVTKPQHCSLLFYNSYFHSNLFYYLLSVCLGFGLLFLF